MNECDKVSFVLSANISCAAGLLLFSTFAAQFGKCPSFSAHLRLQPGCRGAFCAQGELLSPAEQSHLKKSLEWGDPFLSTPPHALHLPNCNNCTHQQCLKMRAAFSGACQEIVPLFHGLQPCCALQPPHTLLSCRFSLPTANLTQLFLKLSLPLAVNCIIATDFCAGGVRGKNNGLWAHCEQ